LRHKQKRGRLGKSKRIFSKEEITSAREGQVQDTKGVWEMSNAEIAKRGWTCTRVVEIGERAANT